MTSVFEIAKKLRKETSCTIALTQRMKNNWGAMLKQNRTKSLKESRENADNVLEHVFIVHVHCNTDWCYAKRAQEEGQVYIPKDKHKFY